VHFSNKTKKLFSAWGGGGVCCIKHTASIYTDLLWLLNPISTN